MQPQLTQPKLILPRTYWRFWADELAAQILDIQREMALAGMAELEFVGPQHPKIPRRTETLRSLQDGMLRRLHGLLERANDDAAPAYQVGLLIDGEVSFSRPNDPRWAIQVRGPFMWLPEPTVRFRLDVESLYVPVTRKVSAKNGTSRGSR